jgi:VWFA-related protein
MITIFASGARRRTHSTGRVGDVLRVQLFLRLVSSVALAGGAVFAQEQPPRFKSAVEVTSIDVTVIDNRGKPIPDMSPADFNVKIDGKDRRVVTAEWVPLVTEGKTAATFVPEGYSSNENATGGRLIVIAVDQPNIRFGGGGAVTSAAGAFIDRLSPSDRIAVTGFGLGAPVTAFTADRQRVKAALARMTGQKQQRSSHGSHQISMIEAQAIGNGDRMMLQSVLDRECGPSTGGRGAAGAAEICRAEVEAEAEEIGRNASHESDQTLRGLKDLLTGLKSVGAPKTLILISEGFVLDDVAFTVEVGSLAAASRTSVYALRLDQQIFDASDGARPINSISDRESRAAGLETLVAAARGTVVNVVGNSTGFFERLEAELSGYYLLGVESDPKDRDGKPHPIRVDVPRKGTTVRTRRQFVSTTDDARARSPREAVTAGLGTPLLMSALPLRVTSFALQGPERGRIQLLIHADIGTDYTSSKAVSIGYMLFDRAGRLVDSQSQDARIPPIMNGVPSPLQYRTGASVAPGDYTLKLAVAEGDKVGSVEHPIHAVLSDADGGVTVSELMVGGPLETDDVVRPTIGYTVSFGNVHGYLEAYTPKIAAVSVKYELAADAAGPALLSAEVPARPAGDGRAIFSHVIRVQQLPAGKYILRAVVSEDGKPVKSLIRAFEVAPPAVLMTSAEGVGAGPSTDAELFLPVGDELLSRPFRRQDAVGRDIVQVFRERVPQTVRATFDSAVALIAAGDYPKAEAALKRAIQPEIDSTASLVYLAVCFAASGHDTEAASVWQTALVDGSDLPQIYDWLGGALMRSHDLTEARTVYEEAAAKWPADVRFTKPLAMLYATFGRGREAVRTLERYLSARHDDRDALFLGVEWIYNVRAAGGVVHSRAQDATLARGYADAYEKTGGPQAALVKQWVEFLEK